MSLIEELSKELEAHPELAKSIAKKLIEYIEPELSLAYQISKMVDQITKFVEEQTKIWQEIKAIKEEIQKIWEEIKELKEEQTRLKEEQTKIWQEIKAIKEEQVKLREDFNKMLSTIRELQVQQGRMERKFERIYEGLSASILYAFGELSKFAGMTFEEFVRRFLTDRMVRAGEIPEGRELRREVIDGEEVDLFLEDPLIVGEVTAHAESAEEIDKLLRKVERIREIYGREPRKILVVETAKKEVAKELRERAEEEGIELVIGREY